MPNSDLQEAILGAALKHVAFDGWTMKALEAGAQDAGCPAADAARAFPGGPVEAVVLHATLADKAMVEAMAALDPQPQRTAAKVAMAIRLRLEAAAPDRDAVRLGLGLLARPQHAPQGLKALGRTVDAVWRSAGDRSADFNWYTKRGLLAAVYMATVNFWLDDKSEGFADTWAFLDRRLADAMRLPMKAKGMLQKFGGGLPRPSRVAKHLRRRRMAGSW
jgi:ubiquinone biosynthesis protein COQ9